MKYKQRLKKFLVCFICLFLIMINSSAAFCAQTAIDPNQKVSLTLINQCSGKTFHIYKAATVREDVFFEKTSDFANYDVSLSQTTQEGWRQAALALSGYVASDNINPTDTKIVDDEGNVSFDNLDQGLYLVVGDTIVKDGYTYITEPFLICLPNEDTDGNWEYAVTAKPKGSTIPPVTPPTDTTITRKVMKVWDDENQADRPACVTIQLLRDGQVYAEVVLSKENDWRYTWDNLDSRYQWLAVEKQVPDGYSVGVAQEGSIFIITNTKDKPEDPTKPVEPGKPENPDKPVKPKPPGKPDDPPKLMVPDDPMRPYDPSNPGGKLPQTSMLWWPVPVMAFFGTALFMTGWFMRKKKNGEYNEQ